MSDIDQLRQLPLPERIQMVEDLWDTIAADSASITLSPAQIAELDCRLDRYEASPQEGIAWATLKDRIENSLS